MIPGLYLHVPFCARRCDYCDFFVVIPGSEGAGERDDFLRWLERDLRQGARRMPAPRRVDSIYCGGGTPSLLPAEALASILAIARDVLEIAPGAEISIEANPEDVTPRKSAAWREAGVTRVSLGVQSLTEAVLRPRGRRYAPEEAIAAARTLREAAFESVGLDFIAGLPGETAGSFADGIDRAVQTGADHVSIYLLELEESGKETPLARAVAERRVDAAPEEETIAMFERACLQLEGAGIERYEISNFAREGRRSRHNLKYWTSAPWLGVGPSAHSHLDGRRFGRPSSLQGWREWVERGGDPGEGDYTLGDAAARAREALVMELRLTRGVDRRDFAARWGEDPLADRGALLEEMEAEGMMELGEGWLRLTPRGMILSNDVFGRIL